jgi:hypothetical protein
MASDAGSGEPPDRSPEHQPRAEATSGDDHTPDVHDRAVDRLSGDRPTAQEPGQSDTDSHAARARAYAEDVRDLGLTTDLREHGRQYLDAVHYDARDAGGDTRHNRDEGYRAAAVRAQYQGLPDLADEAIARISDDGIRTKTVIDTASQAAMLEDPDRVVELIDRLPDEADWNRAWDAIEEISRIDDA